MIVRIRARARRDIAQARQWYEDESTGLGDRFRDDLGAVIRQLEENPFIYQAIQHDVRRAPLRHFPYSVYFIARPPRVAVLRVLHQSRRPPEWER